MKATKIWTIGLLASAFVFAASPALASFEIAYFNDFQKSLDKFVPGAAIDKCLTKDTLKLSFEENSPYTKPGLPGKFNGYAALTSTCGYPVWMLANLTGDGNALRFEFDTRSLEGCDSCIVLAYAGKSVPKYPGQFSTDYKPLGTSWERHVIRLSVEPAPGAGLQADTLVAIGFANLDGTAQFQPQRAGIDNLSITLDAGTPPESH